MEDLPSMVWAAAEKSAGAKQKQQMCKPAAGNGGRKNTLGTYDLPCTFREGGDEK